MRYLAIAVGLGVLQIGSLARADGAVEPPAGTPARAHVSIAANVGIATNAGVGVTHEPLRLASGELVTVNNYGLATTPGLGVNLGVRLGTRRWRAGFVADLVFCLPQTGHATLIDLRPAVSFDVNLRLEDDVRLWLGLAAGPSFRNLDQIVSGVSTVVSLDVAIPISSHFAIDAIVRGGFDEAVSAPTPHPDPVGELALGITWD